MEIPELNPDDQYFQEIRDLCNTAFEASHLRGARHIGRFVSYGTVSAAWTTETGGAALLDEGGVRVGPLMPLPLRESATKLELYDPITPSRPTPGTVTTFDMNLVRRTIEVSHTIRESSTYTYRDVLQREHGREIDREHGLRTPTSDDLARLRTELERGAQGKYRVRPRPSSQT